MTKPQGITPEIVEWISEEIIGEEEETYGNTVNNLQAVVHTWEENRKRSIRNELRREQKRRLRE